MSATPDTTWPFHQRLASWEPGWTAAGADDAGGSSRVEDAEAGIDDRHRQTRDGTKLRPFAGTPFDIGFGEGDGEQADCAWDLEEILASAGWNQLPWGVHAVGIAVIHRNLRPLAGSVGAQNIEIQLEPAHRQGRLAAAEALVATLNSAGIGAREAPYNSANTIVGG